MQKKKLLVCPKCHSFYSVKQSSLDYSCDECDGQLQLVPFDHDVYMSFSDEEKTAFKNKYIEDHFSNDVPPFQPLPQSGWVGFLGCCGWATVIGLLIAGVFVLLTGSFGTGIALMIAAPISGGGLILFSIVAEDVRHIRNQVDKLQHDNKSR